MLFSRLSAPVMGAVCAIALTIPAVGFAHINWTQVNQYDDTAIAMYHLDDTSLSTGSLLNVDSGWAANRSLLIQAPVATGFSSSFSVPEPFFGTSLRMNGSQRADSTANFGYNASGPDLVDKDLTIEFWLKWDAAPSASSVEIGFRSGSKLRITRDTTTPANDQFAIFATHGTFVPAPGFTNWFDVGTEEAPLDEWIHVAVAIDSTGSTFDTISGHHKYNTGSVARFYLNGHAVGTAPHTVPVDGVLDFHSESSLLTIRNISGTVTIDEVAIWSTDLSNGGTAHHPFANGRGTGFLSVENWNLY